FKAAVISWATASSEIRAASPFSTASRAVSQMSAAASSTQAYGSLRRSAGSEDDIDLSVRDLDFRLAQAECGMSLVHAGPDVVLVAVPGADDVQRAGLVTKRADRAVLGHGLFDATVEPALADRTPAVSAVVVPGIEFTIDAEDADLDIAVGDNLPVALAEVFDAADADGFHGTLPPSSFLLGGW